ncbi:MAG: hypothetical protein WBV94_29115 [Blastocatellia bacterium]
MTIRERVIETVIAWSGVDDFLTSDPLENIWARSSDSTAIPFKPQAVTDLIGNLQSAFHAPFVPARDLSSWTPDIFAPPEGINTVDDLVLGVMAAPSPQAHALISGFAHKAARDEFVDAIASAVAEKLKKPRKRTQSKKSPKGGRK